MNPVTGLSYDFYSRPVSVTNRPGATTDKAGADTVSVKATQEFIPASLDYSQSYSQTTDSDQQEETTSLYGQKSGADEFRKGRFVDIHV